MNARSSGPARLILLGAGGHASVLCALAHSACIEVVGVCDPALAAQGDTSWRGLQVLGSDEALHQFDPSAFGVINGIGHTVGSRQREDVYERVRLLGFRFPALVHPVAWVADDVALADGAQVMAGAIVQPGCRVGRNSVVNTGSSLDHGCQVGAHAHIAPGTTLCGDVVVGDGAFVGSGCTVLPGITIGSRAIVGAGAVVSRSVGDHRTALGNPLRFLDPYPVARSDPST